MQSAHVKDVLFMEPARFSHEAKSLARSFFLSLLFVTAALVPELLLKRFFPYPFLFLFFGAVIGSAWLGGMASGLCAVSFSILAVDYFFLPPYFSFTISPEAAMYFAAFVACALIASLVSAAKKRNEVALKEIRDQLEVRVSERTESLMRTEAELARLSRVLSMGELTASIAHEVKQPLTAVVANGEACIEWLSSDPPNLERVRQTTRKIVQDGTRAGAVLSRMRALFKNEPPLKEWLDINDVIQDLMLLLRMEAQRHNVGLRTELTAGLPKLKGDRIQLQQVVLNLMMNGMDAMSEAHTSGKDLIVRTRQQSTNEITVEVEDSGAGVSAEVAHKMFDPFFTTKPHGIGMGLSISRSIIESHEGRLWASARPGGGTIFQFVVPVQSQDSNG